MLTVLTVLTPVSLYSVCASQDGWRGRTDAFRLGASAERLQDIDCALVAYRRASAVAPPRSSLRLRADVKRVQLQALAVRTEAFVEGVRELGRTLALAPTDTRAVC